MKITIIRATAKPHMKCGKCKKSEETKVDAKTAVENEIARTLGRVRMDLPNTISGMVQAFTNRVMSESNIPLTFEISASAVEGAKPYFSVFTSKPFSHFSLEDRGGIVPDITVENLQDMFIKVCENDIKSRLREEGIEC